MSLHNQANITNFLFDIPDAGLTRGFQLNIQTALIPGIRISPTNVPSGSMGLGRANVPGSSMEFDPLVVRFLVDENLDSWLEMYRWMLIINNYLTLHNSAWDKGDAKLPDHVTLNILDNCKKNIVLSIHYYGAWCSELGEIEFSYTEEGNPAITCTATFNYKYFQVEKDGVIIEDRLSMQENHVKEMSTKDISVAKNPRV